jgi:cobyrinic acid a,c-diamide synthase
MRGRDVAVVEGVMGLYDGRSARSEEGSGAQVAKLLGLPVLLVLDAAAAARSVAATVLGFRQFDRDVRFLGVVLNNVGSERHAALCREAIETYTGVPVLGALVRSPGLTLPERHLGLVPVVEGPAAAEVFERIVDAVSGTVDVDRVLAQAGGAALKEPPPVLFPGDSVPAQARIAVAQDRAFSFYYQDSLDLLEAWGAEIVPFSPLANPRLPENTDGAYIGGGFPELYARELAENRALQESLRAAARHGAPIYAECGGLMYLGRSIVDFEGASHSMTDLVPAVSRLAGSKLTLGYRMVRALRDGPVLQAGDTARGHEFHWSRLEKAAAPAAAAYAVLDEPGRHEGFQCGSVLASYIHLHLGSAPGLAARFVERCRAAREAR